jgi:hypothetical protein
MFELLLSAGADVNTRDKYGFTLAHIVTASPGDNSEFLERLCTMGLRLDVVDNLGETPFTQANRYGNLKCSEFLLQKGVDVNQRGGDKMTSLIIAGQKGLLEVCQWLVSKGADVHAKDRFNKTALDWAKANGHAKVVEFLEQQLKQSGSKSPPLLPAVPPKPPVSTEPHPGARESGVLSKPGGFFRSLKQLFSPARAEAVQIPSPASRVAPVTPKSRITESGRFIAAACWSNKPRRLPVSDGGTLELQPEKFIPYEFSFGLKAVSEDVDYLRSIVRLTDAQGVVWEGESVWSPSWFVEQGTDSAQAERLKSQADADAELLRSLEENSFIRGVRDLLDDRFHRELSLSGRRYVVPFKYQVPVLDLAAHQTKEDKGTSANLVVRVSGLYAHISDESRDKIPLPTVVFTVDVSERLFVNYFVEEEEGAWGDREIPEIVIFHRSTLKGEANEFVRFSPSKS